MTRLKTYSLFFVLILLCSACARRAKFEWIRINPDKIKEANTRVAYRNGIKNVDITLGLKEKAIPIYYESPEAFEAGKSTPLIITKPEIVAKPRVKSKAIIRPAVKLKKDVIVKPVAKKSGVLPKSEAPKANKNTPKAIPEEESIALDKLNGAMRIPKKPIIQIIGEEQETATPVKKVVKKVSITNQKTLATKTVAKQTLAIEQKIVSSEVRLSLKKTDQINELLNARKGNNFILAGSALAVIGVVLGLIFSKTAYLITGAGIIFAAIGFLIKV